MGTSRGGEDECVSGREENVSLGNKNECPAEAKFKRNKTCGCVEGQVGWKEIRMVREEKWPGPVRVERALWGDPCWMGAEHKGKGAVGLPWQRDRGKEKGVRSEAAEEPVSEKLQARYKLGYEVEIENHTNE